jgi:hypothetical protein
MTKILVVGCSMTNGHGLVATPTDPYKLDTTDSKLWVNHVCRQMCNDPQIVNLAKSGRNNHWIFTETACALAKDSYDIVIVAWSELARYNFNVGLELYPTLTTLGLTQDININPGVTVSAQWLTKLGDQLRRLYNDHWMLLDLIKYVNILKQIQVDARNSKLFFVNTLFTFPPNYFEHKPFTTISNLPDYTQDLLQGETRDDNEVEKLYNMIYSQYNDYGGIQSDLWLNLYDSFLSMQIDSAQKNDPHPGYKSQQVFSDYLIPVLTEKLNETMHNNN